MRIPTNAMLGMSRKLRVASQKGTTKSLQKDIKTSKAKVAQENSVRVERKVAQARAENFAPKKIPSVYETGRIRHPKNAWRRPKMPDNSKMPNGPKMLPHQTSNWSKQKSPVSEGNYLAWKYQGFPADKSPFNKGKKGY